MGRLSGQTEGRIVASAGSSPAPSTRSARTRLWKRLRRLDSQIGQLDRVIEFRVIMYRGAGKDLIAQREKKDAKRKEVRMKLKGKEATCQQ